MPSTSQTLVVSSMTLPFVWPASFVLNAPTLSGWLLRICSGTCAPLSCLIMICPDMITENQWIAFNQSMLNIVSPSVAVPHLTPRLASHLSGWIDFLKSIRLFDHSLSNWTFHYWIKEKRWKIRSTATVNQRLFMDARKRNACNTWI